MIAEHELLYVAWQNRATRFYLAARTLSERQLHGPAAYCAHQAAELILKATLVYWDKSFRPRSANHNLQKLVRMIRNKVPGARQFAIPSYLSSEQRFLRVTRYPVNGQGVYVPVSLIGDLDSLFVDLVLTVPFQFNTQLKSAVFGRDRRGLIMLRRANGQLRRLRKYLRLV